MAEWIAVLECFLACLEHCTAPRARQAAIQVMHPERQGTFCALAPSIAAVAFASVGLRNWLPVYAGRLDNLEMKNNFETLDRKANRKRKGARWFVLHTGRLVQFIEIGRMMHHRA